MTHPLVAAYLDRLRAAASVLPAERAAELLADLTDHLDAAVPPGATDADAAAAVHEVGEPERLVAEAASDLPSASGPAAGASAPTVVVAPRRVDWELLALVGLILYLPLVVVPPVAFLVWVASVAILLGSSRFTGLDKLLGLLWAVLPTASLVAGALGGYVCTTTTVVGPEGPERTIERCDPSPYLGPIDLRIVVQVALVLLGIAALYGYLRLWRRLRLTATASGRPLAAPLHA